MIFHPRLGLFQQKQKQDEEDAKRLRLLSRKKELEANDRAKKAAEEKAYLEQKREEERKRVIKDKILGPQKAVSIPKSWCFSPGIVV